MIQTIEDIKDRLKSISLYLRIHPDYALLNDQEITDNVDSLEDVIIYIDNIVKKESRKSFGDFEDYLDSLSKREFDCKSISEHIEDFL